MSKIRLVYLYLFAAVGLITVIVGTVRMVELGLKTFVFKDVDQYEIYPTKPVEGQIVESAEEMKQRQIRETTRNRQRDLVGALSMLIVGFPVYFYHWQTIQKENKRVR